MELEDEGSIVWVGVGSKFISRGLSIGKSRGASVGETIVCADSILGVGVGSKSISRGLIIGRSSGASVGESIVYTDPYMLMSVILAMFI